MIVTFLVGSIIGLIGRIGGDMMSVISYVVSLENFNSEEPVLINKLGKANQYLNVNSIFLIQLDLLMIYM